MEQEYWLLRGARIVKQLEEQQKQLEEHQELSEVSTVPDLHSNIVQAFPATRKRQHATGEVAVTHIEYIPYVGMKLLHVKSATVSGGMLYKQAIQFQRVVFNPQDAPTTATFTASDGDYHIEPLNLADHNVKVRCNCLDFRFRFANYNSDDKSLVGKPPPPYRRKTTTRPEVNPDHVPGVCKHLLKVIQTMQRYGLVNSAGI